MAEMQIWKRAVWRWRYWIAMGVLALFPLLHIVFPTLYPDWIVAILQVMVDAV